MADCLLINSDSFTASITLAGMVLRMQAFHWRMDVWVGGHRVRRKYPDKRTAGLVEKDLKVKEARGESLGIREIKRITFEAFSKDYLKYVKTNLSPGRYRHVENVNEAVLIPFFGARYLKEITPRLVEKFKTEQAKRLKASSTNEYLNILKAMFNLAERWGNIKENPLRHVKGLKVDTVEPPHLSPEEANKLLDLCRRVPNLYVFTALGLYTGMRIGEIVNLTWPDVDLRRRVAKVRPKEEGDGVRVWRVKTGDIREIDINGFLAEVLSRHPRHIKSPYILYQDDGRPCNVAAMRSRLEKVATDAGFPVQVYPHLLRHTFGTALAANGVDLDTIRRLIGHTDIKMTMRYLHAAPNRMQRAVETLSFGGPMVQDLDNLASG